MKKYLKILAAALLIAAVFTGIAGSGLLMRLGNIAADRLYQQTGANDGEIVIIGMDQYALDQLGPMPWPRSVMAQVLAKLNEDPETAPAAIGVDVLYVGQSADPEGDQALSDAAALQGNVVFAAAGTFGSSLVIEENNSSAYSTDDASAAGEDSPGFYMDDMSLLAWDRPYDALIETADYGHINAMYDKDGILRHALLEVNAPEGYVESFAARICSRYSDYLDQAGEGEAHYQLPETDEKGFYYLKYTSKPGSYYDGISVADVLEGTVDPDYYAGKIVLIGPYAAGMQDEYTTAADHSSHMYGIEIQANIIDAMRYGLNPKEASHIPQLALLFVISAAAFLWFRNRKMAPAIISWLAVSLGWLAVCYIAGGAGVLLQVLYIPLAVTVLFIACVAWNYIAAALEKRRVTATFGRYVDPAILNELLVQGGAAEQLGGVRKEIAVLFVDIRGFTTMSEGLEPETVVEIINMYLTLTTDCIMRNHGTLDKFVGDCTMAFWNAPLPQEDCIYLACRAAMDMVEGSKALGEKLQERFGRTVDFGVGVNFGPAVVGNIGAPKRMDYTAIGDTVNTASRLESNAPAGTVYISRVVADALGDRATTTSLGGSIKLKGKAEGFEILTLDSLE